MYARRTGTALTALGLLVFVLVMLATPDSGGWVLVGWVLVLAAIAAVGTGIGMVARARPEPSVAAPHSWWQETEEPSWPELRLADGWPQPDLVAVPPADRAYEHHETAPAPRALRLRDGAIPATAVPVEPVPVSTPVPLYAPPLPEPVVRYALVPSQTAAEAARHRWDRRVRVAVAAVLAGAALRQLAGNRVRTGRAGR